MDEMFDVVVIGAGQGGLATSYLLRESGVRHVVLERGDVGESWRSQRWDSFCLNTPNWSNSLPGLEFSGKDSDSFAPREELISYFERYVSLFELPVRDHTPVTGLKRLSTGDYSVQADGVTLRARAVVIAAGGMSRPKVPGIARNLPSGISSLAAGEYRNPDALPDGSVVVVGSGQSGCQIAEDLLNAGRRVFLCASRVGRAPRSYRGRDIFEWMRDSGFLEVGVEELEDPAMQFAAQPQVSGTHGGHTVSLQSLARDGATLLGRVTGVDGDRLELGDNLLDCIAFADEKAKELRQRIDEFIARANIDAPPPEPDPGEPPLPELNGSDQMEVLDLRPAGVGCVIWCTGYDADWSWVKIDAFDEDGRPRHQDGITQWPGLYFAGLNWLSKRKSGILYGAPEDAERVVEHIGRYLRGLKGA
jgi:putative flavoprotein involved in K+ transport